MADKTWKAINGIKFMDKWDEAAQPEGTTPEDATPARNGIWDTRETQDLDQVALHGFTIDELVDLGALAATKNDEENVLANNLNGPVHPAFAIDRWETTVPAHFKREDLFPIGLDEDGNLRPGDYVASNKIVWQAILPSLLLVSKFVENAHIFPWYSAVLHSDIYPVSNISPEAEKLDEPLRNFHFRPKSDLISPKMEELTRERIAAIVENLSLGISDGKADPTGKSPHLRVNYDGVSIPPWADDGETYRIYIAYQVIERLLEENIGPSTKLSLQFYLALTLLHEFAHVLVFAKDGARNVKLFLGNERVSEVGFSFEMNTFGGHPVLVVDHIDKPEYFGTRAGFLLEDWLGTAKGHQLTQPLTGTDSDWNDREWREARSIPISFLEELGQEDFWRCFVSRWGAEALKVYPWTAGRIVRRDGDALQTQVYSAPPEDREWLQSALAYNTDPATLSTNDAIAHKIAKRRISRDKEIRNLSRTGRGLEEKRPEEETKASPGKSQSQDKTPWEVRAEDIEIQNAMIINQVYSCAEEKERVRQFLRRKDVESPGYLQTQEILVNNNIKECRSLRKQLTSALDDESLSQMEQILANYEAMKGQLGRVSRQSSEDRGFKKKQLEIKNECTALLKKARQCRDRGEHERCSEYCVEVLAKDGASNFHRASAYLLNGLSITDPQMKLWYLTESVRVFKVVAHLEGANTKESTRTMTEHAKRKLKNAVTKFGPTILTSIEVKKPNTNTEPQIIIGGPPEKIPRPETPKPAALRPGPRGSPPKTPQNQIGIVPTNIFRPKKTRQTFSGFGNPPDSILSDSTLSGRSTGAPEDMSPLEVMRHHRTFKVINQARRNFFDGEYTLAEGGFLELLNLEATTYWQKARCNVFLASIPRRTDRAQRAQTALRMYREILKDDPDDERRIVAVEEAKEMVKRVLMELGEESSSTGLEDGKTGDARVSFETSKPSPTSGRIDLLSDSGVNRFEGGNRDQANRKKEEKKPTSGTTSKGQQITPKSTSLLHKITGFLGTKRRREDDDDGENERGNLDKRVQPSSS